jgi:serine/threonine protein kinase
MERRELSGEVLAQLVPEHLGKLQASELLWQTNNLVYRIDTDKGSYILKIYDTKAPNPDLEPYVSQVFPGHQLLRKIILFDSSKKKLPNSYALLEYIDGDGFADYLDKNLLQDAELERYAKQIVGFIRSCSKVKLRGFGKLDSNLIGQSKSWEEFSLNEIRKDLGIHLRARTFSKNKAARILRAMEKFAAYYKTIRRGVMTPMDLNARNFLVTKDRKLKLIDSGAVWAGDILFSYGELMAHYYTTKFWSFIEKHARLSPKQMLIVHGYALLSDIGISRFIVANGAKDIQGLAPWGNKSSFLDLMDRHLEYLEKNFEKVNIAK